MRRKIEQSLLQWKQNPNRKPLVVKGCRQCGKTYSVLSFARANYEHVIYLNFHEQPSYKKLHFFYAIYCVFHKKVVPLRQITE